MTDRFTKAIEQLGKSEDGRPLVEVRLGGIDALEAIGGTARTRPGVPLRPSSRTMGAV